MGADDLLPLLVYCIVQVIEMPVLCSKCRARLLHEMLTRSVRTQTDHDGDDRALPSCRRLFHTLHRRCTSSRCPIHAYPSRIKSATSYVFPHRLVNVLHSQEFLLEEMACGEAGYFMMCGNAVLGYLLEAEAKLPVCDDSLDESESSLEEAPSVEL